MNTDVCIAVIAPTEPEDAFDAVWQGVWEATFDISHLGVHVQDLPTRGDDLEGQRTSLRELLDAAVSAIAIMPAHRSQLDPLIAEHARRGTAVITFLSDAPESGRLALVGPDLMQSGRLAGEVLVKLMGGRGGVVAFPGPLEQHRVVQHYRGFQAELERHQGRVTLLDTAPDPLAALSQAGGVYVDAGDIARVAQALEQAGLSIPCVAFDNTEQVRALLGRGVVSAAVDEHPYLQAYFAVQKAYEATMKSHGGGSISGIRIPSNVLLVSNSTDAEAGDELHSAFELLVHQRTEVLRSYQEKLEAANEQLRSLSVTDALTGLLNRRAFEVALEMEAARGLRYGEVSLLMIDLDRFKRINDRYGHPTGDAALRAVARTLAGCCRETDVCARYGGDEFAIILPQTDAAGGAVVRDRILAQIAGVTTPAGGEDLRISLSIGAATLPGDATSGAALVTAADAAMYQAKAANHARRAGAG